MHRRPPRELNPHGIEQAHRVGEALAELGYRHLILSSPYARTLQTAKIIAEHVDVIAVESLEILREYEAPESLHEMIKRAYIALDIACDLYKFNPIIISHREPIRAMASPIFSRPMKEISVPKAGGFILHFDGLSAQYNAETWKLT